MKKKWWTPLITIGIFGATAYSDTISGWVASHPKVSAILWGVSTLLATFAPQPQKPDKP